MMVSKLFSAAIFAMVFGLIASSTTPRPFGHRLSNHRPTPNSNYRNRNRTPATPRLQLPQCVAAEAEGIRLVGTGECTQAVGRVEVQIGGVWGTVCDDYWGTRDARVVCRQLGFTQGNVGWAYYGYNSLFQHGSGVIHLDDVHCTGDEETLTACQHTRTHNCVHYEDAGVDCENVGTLEHYGWNGRTPPAAPIQCEEQPSVYNVPTQDGVAQYGNNERSCFYFEAPEGEVARLQCETFNTERGFDYLTLTDDSGAQIRRLHGHYASPQSVLSPGRSFTGTWRSDRSVPGPGFRCTLDSVVPTEEMIANAAAQAANEDLVSRRYYNPPPSPAYRPTPYPNTRRPWLNTPRPQLPECIAAGGVEEGVRLVGTGECESLEGRVEVYDSTNAVWGTVCDDGWSTNDARVVCNQLGFTEGNVGRAYSRAFFQRGTGPILLDDVHCDGTEDDLLTCLNYGYGRHNCGHYEDAGVSCEDTADDEYMLYRTPGTRRTPSTPTPRPAK